MNDLEICAETLRLNLIARATGKEASDEDYKLSRKTLMGDVKIKQLLPSYIHICRDLEIFWDYIKGLYPSYAERRRFINEGLAQVLNHIEDIPEISTLIAIPAERLNILSTEFLNQQITKCQEKIRSQDYDGAITNARSLVEEVLIELEAKIKMEERAAYNGDLNALYKRVRELMNFTIDSETIDPLKKIISGLNSIVDGLGSLRNKLGDAHTRGTLNPSKHHAELAVNSAKTFFLFIISSYEYQKERL